MNGNERERVLSPLSSSPLPSPGLGTALRAPQPHCHPWAPSRRLLWVSPRLSSARSSPAERPESATQTTETQRRLCRERARFNCVQGTQNGRCRTVTGSATPRLREHGLTLVSAQKPSLRQGGNGESSWAQPGSRVSSLPSWIHHRKNHPAAIPTASSSQRTRRAPRGAPRASSWGTRAVPGAPRSPSPPAACSHPILSAILTQFRHIFLSLCRGGINARQGEALSPSPDGPRASPGCSCPACHLSCSIPAPPAFLQLLRKKS